MHRICVAASAALMAYQQVRKEQKQQQQQGQAPADAEDDDEEEDDGDDDEEEDEDEEEEECSRGPCTSPQVKQARQRRFSCGWPGV